MFLVSLLTALLWCGDSDTTARASSPWAVGSSPICRGMLAALLQQHDRAVAEFTEAIRIEPQSARAYALRGSAYGLKQDYDRALEDLTTAVSLDPKNPILYRSRAFIWGRKKEFGKAVEDYSAALVLDPTNTRYY